MREKEGYMSVKVVLASASPARLKTLRNAGVEPLVIVSDVDEEALVEAADAASVAETGQPLEPAAHAQLLARAKAEAVAARLTEPPSLRETPATNQPTPPSLRGAFATKQSSPPSLRGALATKQSSQLGNCLNSGDGADHLDGDLIIIGCDSVFELDGMPFGKPENPTTATERIKQMRGRTGLLHTGHWIIDSASDRSLGAVGTTKVTFGDIDDDEIADYVATGEPLHVAGSFTVDGLGGPYVTSIEGDYHNVVGISLPLLRQLLSELSIPWRELRS
jgi:septum formation protein